MNTSLNVDENTFKQKIDSLFWFKILKKKYLRKKMSVAEEVIPRLGTRTLVWCRNGKYHRDDDLPAIVFPNGTKEWYQDGLFHRDGDMPAVEYSNGTKYWYQLHMFNRD
jgi:hypothetical protein